MPYVIVEGDATEEGTVAHPSHKAGTRWFPHASGHGAHSAHSHKAQASTQQAASRKSSSFIWHRSAGRHAAVAVSVRPTLIAGTTGLLTAAALAFAGAVGVQAQTGRSARGSFSPVTASASASRSASRAGSAAGWSLDSAGEFDVSRAFSLTDAKKITDAVTEYKPTAVIDSGGRYQSIGVSSHQAGTNAGFDSYDFSECTWWVAVRRSQLGRPVPSHMGNGGQWADSARAKGLSVDNTPKVGDVAVFAPGQAGAVAFYGHVAVVEAVLSDGSVLISECSEGSNGQIKVRRIWDASRYQYIH